MKPARFILLALAGIATPIRADNPRYTIIDLGTLGGSASHALAINALGQVVGDSMTAGGQCRAFRYSAGTMSSLGTLGGSYSYAWAINSVGQVVGVSQTSSGQDRAFLYSNGTMTNLGTLPGSITSVAAGINDSGQIVGIAQFLFGSCRAFLYAGGSMTDIGTLGGTFAGATGINSSGQISGTSSITGGAPAHAFRYTAGSMLDLGTLGGNTSSGNGINELGQVVGWSYASSGQAHAFLYSAGAMTDLGTLNGEPTYGRGVNASAQVVGYSQADNGTQRAFLYNADTMTALSELLTPGSGWTLTWANGINDSGSIVGWGTINGQTRAFLMVIDCNANGASDAEDIANGTSLDSNGNGVPDECEFVLLAATNPPTDNPFLPSQQPFRDVLQTGPTAPLLQGIGSCLTPTEGGVNYCTITVTFTQPTTMHVADIGIVCSYTGTPPGSALCPTVSEVTGSGVGPYSITLDAPIPPGGCATLTFANAAPGQVLRYEYLPGDVNMSGTTTGQDVLALVTAINMGMAGGAPNLPRYDINRNGIVTGQDVLRLVQLLNGQNTTQEWNGATLVPCP